MPRKATAAHAAETVVAAPTEGNRQYQVGRDKYREARRAHWDQCATRKLRASGRGYHRRLEEVYGFLVPTGARVLELGCGRGDLLAALSPAHGVGVDFSPRMVEQARRDHPQLTFIEADVHELDLEERFDVIILSDLLNDLWDVQEVLQVVRRHSCHRTRVIINGYSRLWQPALGLLRALGLATPLLSQNWLTVADITGLLALEDLEVIRGRSEVLLPCSFPLLSQLLNRFAVKLWPFRWFALTNFVVARPRARPSDAAPRVSVIVPARNEAGHIEDIFRRTPELGGGTELIFVEGHSTDDTQEVLERTAAKYPERRVRLLRQSGKGKGDAVRLGFAEATGDVLMILDADLTVPPESLPRFLDALVQGRGEFINGVRLTYPMDERAMRFLNLLGNKFFSLAFSWLLEQDIKDTLCGTKVLYKSDYERIAANRSYFGELDPFGDFDLIFGAARQNLKLIDLPIRYGERTYGTTNIQRWRHGWLLLRMAALAAGRIKFV